MPDHTGYMRSASKPYRSARIQWVAEQKRKKFAMGSCITVTFSEEARSLLDYVRYARDCSVSDAVEYLMAKMWPREPFVRDAAGLMVFPADDGPPITLEDIQYLLEQEYVYPPKTQKPTPRRTSVRITQETLKAIENYVGSRNVSMSKALCTSLLITEPV